MRHESIQLLEQLYNKRVLAIQPHYDDNDLGAGGTLALMHDHGAEIHYLTVTDDLVGVVDTTLSDEQASARLRQEQMCAGPIIGVKEQHWLGYPDAGDYNYIAMRKNIIRFIRSLRPDYLFTCDPWLPYEAHRDHIFTGLAVSEASYLQGMLRLKTDPRVDRAYIPYEITAVVFYFTHAANTIIDTSASESRKERAVACYRTQFSTPGMHKILDEVRSRDRQAGKASGFDCAERLKVLYPRPIAYRYP